MRVGDNKRMELLMLTSVPLSPTGMGEVSISWVGAPSNDFLTEKAIDILNSYLTDSAISPLQKALVEIEDPYATDLGFDISDQLTTVLNLGLSSVPTEKLNEVAPKVKEVLAGIVEAGVDMKRMEMILNREQRKVCIADRCRTDQAGQG